MGSLLASCFDHASSRFVVCVAGNRLVSCDLGAGTWPAKAWIVLAAWTLVGIRVAVWAYRKDTARA